MTDLIFWYDTANGKLNPRDSMSFTLRFNSSCYMAPLCISLMENLVSYHETPLKPVKVRPNLERLRGNVTVTVADGL